jgi:hypothetical protein
MINPKINSFSGFATALAALAAAGGIAHAVPITILNAGFEDPLLAVDGDFGSATHWDEGTYAEANPGVWMPGVTNDAGNWNPDPADGFTDGAAFAGKHVGWTTSYTGVDGGLAQVLADTLQANTEYVLSVQVGNSFYNANNVSADNRIELLAGGALLASITGTSPGTDSWELHTLTYSSGVNPAQLGQPLEIRLIAVAYTDPDGADGYEVEWDEVTLTAESAGFEFQVTSSGLDLNFSWKSSAGKIYDILSATDLSNPPASWTPWVSDISASPPTNTESYARPGDPIRFFAVRERALPPLFTEDFESGQGEWTTGSDGEAGTLWELGNPAGGAITGPTVANSPDNCFGTNLSREYGLNAEIWLRSPTIDLNGVTSATLKFRQWVDIDDFAAGDFGTVRVLDPAGLPGAVTELGVVATDIQGANPTSWALFSMALPPEALDREITLEFRFLSDNEETFYAGWYIDDVAVVVP